MSFALVASVCLVALLLGAAIIMRSRAVSHGIEETSDIEKGTARNSDFASAAPSLSDKVPKAERRTIRSSTAFVAGGSARPM
jgi:hypothetical protein